MKRKDKRSKLTQQIALTGMLGALALVLSALEGMLPPLPMLPPGAKLGLSNLATMYAAGSVGLLPALGIAVIKGLFAGVTRGVTALLMSLCGGLLSTLIMGLLLRWNKNPFGLVGLGVCGALAHNAAQLTIAACLLGMLPVLFYIPWLLFFGVVSGILTGLVLRAMLPFFHKFSL